ncbi:hypothetical protein H8B02_23015 [Bradyrhizobium sp. Pear77]|uniref:hypothetical protein n=1 Tax=Bradyrhizobium altum TaxID=1571202 RepID=UPI001E606714|nr:hypothetical protein [Bradyrhizobium altum]MCC8956194.1 hypothetical protein [Bradyrhizobium altum]
MSIEERDFASERELEDAVGRVASDCLRKAGKSAVIVRGYGLDLAVFSQVGCFFFEVKAFDPGHGRCGFGNQKGEGNQIRLLFDSGLGRPRQSEELALFNRSIRWILGDRSKQHGAARYAFFTSQQAQAAAAGGVRPGKQNNLRISAFEHDWVTWAGLIDRVNNFLLNS